MIRFGMIDEGMTLMYRVNDNETEFWKVIERVDNAKEQYVLLGKKTGTVRAVVYKNTLETSRKWF